MKTTTLILTISFWFLIHYAFGQSLDVGFGQYGAMIYWKGVIPKNNSVVEIMRTTTGQPSSTLAWTLHPVLSEEDFRLNIQKIPAIFKDVFPFEEKSPGFFLEKYRHASTTEEIPLFQSPNIAFALGLAIWDSTALQTRSYQYQIMVDGQPVQSPVYLKAGTQKKLSPPPVAAHSTSEEKTIKVSWFIPREIKSNVYSFIPYKTLLDQIGYEPVQGFRSFSTLGDTLLAVFRDTNTISKPGVYQYIISLMDRFGNIGEASMPNRGSNLPATSSPYFLNLKARGLNEQPAIRVSWNLVNAWRVRNLTLYRSRSFDDGYEKIANISPTDSVYVDPVTDVMESYFYYFSFTDIASFVVNQSAKVMGVSEYQYPGQTPDSISASAKGKIISILWKRAGFQDRGYYVLRADGYGEPDKIVSSFIPIREGQLYYSWNDTTELKPDSYYAYAVISESEGYLKSKPTKAVYIRQDVPVFIAIPSDLKISRQSDSTFLLRWDNMASSTANHLIGYKVFQRDNAKPNSYRCLTPELISSATNYIALKNIHPGDSFAVKAYNVFGNESEFSDPVKYEDPFYYKFGPQYLIGKNEEKGIRINWTQPSYRGITQYKIYRMTLAGEKTQIATVKAPHTDYLDTRVKTGVTYYYFITADAQDGLSSEASELTYVTR